MLLFTFADAGSSQPDQPPVTDETSMRRSATPQSIFGGGRKPEAKEIPTEQLTKEYQARVDEIFQIINSKRADSSGKISVDKVTVKLGVEAGGKIGWFVEGRLDVSFAFEVEFKVSE